MRQVVRPKYLVRSALFLGLLSATQLVEADAPKGFEARVVCHAQPKYVLCAVPVAAAPGGRIAFAEANLVKEPKFIKAISTKSTFNDEARLKPDLRFGFVVKGKGTGQVVIQARAIICDVLESARCEHHARVLVGNVTIP